MAAAERAVAAPVLSWVKDTGLPHYHMTRGLVTGTGAQGTLTVEGMRFVRLLSGIPEIPAVK